MSNFPFYSLVFLFPVKSEYIKPLNKWTTWWCRVNLGSLSPVFYKVFKKHPDNNHFKYFLKFKSYQSVILSPPVPRMWLILLSNRDSLENAKPNNSGFAGLSTINQQNSDIY